MLVIREKGALVAHLSDFGKLTIEQQLSYAIYSDLVRFFDNIFTMCEYCELDIGYA